MPRYHDPEEMDIDQTREGFLLQKIMSNLKFQQLSKSDYENKALLEPR